MGIKYYDFQGMVVRSPDGMYSAVYNGITYTSSRYVDLWDLVDRAYNEFHKAPIAKESVRIVGPLSYLDFSKSDDLVSIPLGGFSFTLKDNSRLWANSIPKLYGYYRSYYVRTFLSPKLTPALTGVKQLSTSSLMEACCE